jgi:hypothetical protein
MSAAQKSGWDEFGEYHGPFTPAPTTFPCPVPGPCPCAEPCEWVAKNLRILPCLAAAIKEAAR